MKVAFYTLGCKVNAYETEAVREQFVKAGYQVVDFQAFSDIYIINSCMVTNAGEKKSKKIIRRPSQINPKAIVIVMGCLSQLKAEEMLKIDGVKIVVGTKYRDHLLAYLEDYLVNYKALNKVEALAKQERYDALSINDFLHHQRAFLKIQDGCNNFCSYCIIPYTRGRVRSKAKEIVLSEARKLVEAGHIELVLTGIHTGGYGEDLEDYSFAHLLEDLEAVDGLKRIRISSIEITELTDEVIDIISRSKKIVNHLHIPLQGGTDALLKAMNRKYTTEAFLYHIKYLREKIKDLAVTTDIIVGFPGETEADIDATIALAKSIDFQELHVFPFSKREGTKAAKMSGHIPGDIKKARAHRLLTLSDELKQKHMKKQIGKIHYVIPEQIKDGFLQGHTRDYFLVRLSGTPDLIGQEVECIIDDVDGHYCYAKRNPVITD